MPTQYDPNRFEDMANDNALSNPEAAKAAAAQALNSLLFGHGPQAYAAAKNPAQALRAVLGGTAQQSPAYVADRDEASRYLADTERKYPAATIVGKGAAIMGQAAGPGLAMKPAATALGRIGQAAGVGALYGGAQNPGDKAGELNPYQFEDRAVNAGIGAGVGGTIGTAGELMNKVGTKASGFSNAQSKAYRDNRGAVKQIAKGSDLENQALAERHLKASADAVKNRTFGDGGLEDQLQAQFRGKTIPEGELTGAGQYAPARPQAYINSAIEKGGFGPSYQNIPEKELPAFVRNEIPPRDVPVSEVYQSARAAGTDSTRWRMDPIDGSIVRATNQPAADAWSFLRGKAVNAADGAGPVIDQIKQGIDAQQGIRAGFNRPSAFMKSAAPDTVAARQAADAITGGGLNNAADQFSAGYFMKGNKANGLIPILGRAGITASKAAQPIAYGAASALTPGGQFLDEQPQLSSPRAPAKFDPNRFEVVE